MKDKIPYAIKGAILFNTITYDNTVLGETKRIHQIKREETYPMKPTYRIELSEFGDAFIVDESDIEYTVES